MELQQLDRKQMADFLAEHIDTFRRLARPDQERLISMAQIMLARNYSERFILAGIASTASVMEDLLPEPDDIMNTEKVQQFVRENSAPGRRRGASRPPREVKQFEREQYLESLNAMLREARSVKGHHEIKKNASSPAWNRPAKPAPGAGSGCR